VFKTTKVEKEEENTWKENISTKDVRLMTKKYVRTHMEQGKNKPSLFIRRC
jgi:hypothetical protein